MTTLEKVKKVIAEEKEILTKKYNIERIGIFGSVVRGEDTDKSDVDLIVDFKKPIGLMDLVGLEFYLSDKIGRKVEVATRKSLSPYIQDRVFKQERTIYGRLCWSR